MPGTMLEDLVPHTGREFNTKRDNSITRRDKNNCLFPREQQHYKSSQSMEGGNHSCSALLIDLIQFTPDWDSKRVWCEDK